MAYARPWATGGRRDLPDDDLPGEEEIAVHRAPEGPVAAALAWLHLVHDEGNVAAAWLITHSNLRLVLAQNLIWPNRSAVGVEDLDELAEALAERIPSHPLWTDLQQGLLRVLGKKYEGVPPVEKLAPLRPRPVDPSHELVFLVDPEMTGPVIAPDAFFESVTLLMSLEDDSWRVAGFADREPSPGWPPEFPPEALTPLI